MYNILMNKMSPRDFFTHIGVIVTLYVSSISLIALLFQVINIAYPDPLYGYLDPYSSGIRWAIASLIIIFPLYIFLSWLLDREYRLNPEKRNLGIRRWLTFLTLFVTGAAIATDLIVLINSFLGGEISLRFVLKVMVVLVVTGFVFGYYLWDLRRTSQTTSGRPRIFAVIAGLMAIASVIGGFVIMGSPNTQRLMRLDAAKTDDLQIIQWQIVNFWQQKRALPSQLADLNDAISGFMVPLDPEAEKGKKYEYRIISNLSFELCADFNLASRDGYGKDGRAVPIQSGFGPGIEQTNWQHGVGRVCFERAIDPELYPPNPATVQNIGQKN